MTDYKKLYEEEVQKNKKLKDKSKGFSNLFKKNKELNKFRNDVIETLKMDEDVEDEEMINMLDEMENDWDPIEMIELEKGKEILATQYKEHKIEIMKLKGQVEKNLERNQDLKDFRSVCDSLSLPELTDDCLMEYITELKGEIEKLKAKVAEIPDLLEEERYKERAQNEQDWEDKDEEERLDREGEIEKLEEENEKLKAELNAFVSVFDGNTSMKKMKEENAKLKQEIKKLQGDRCILTKLKERVEYCEGIMEQDEDLEERHKVDMSDLTQKIKETYQENKKLKSDIAFSTRVAEKEAKKKQRTKVEIDKLKTWISEFADFFDHDENHKGIYKKITGLDVEEEEEEEEEEKCEECNKVLEGEDKCGKGCPAYDKGWEETHDN